MAKNRRSWIPLLLGAVPALGGGPAAAHYVTGVRADPALPMVGETVTLTVEGQFSDGCGRITWAIAEVAGNRILVSVSVIGPGPGVYCPMVIVPFTEEVQVAGLAAGNYVIDVRLFVSEFEQYWIQFFPNVAELFVHSGRQRYQLRPGSWFMDTCPVCTNVPVNVLPVTDLDEDGDVDAADSAMFENCMTGPKCGPALAGCEAADFDADGDIDQTDFAFL